MQFLKNPMGYILGVIIGLFVFLNILHFLNKYLDDVAIKMLIFVIAIMMIILWTQRINNRTFNLSMSANPPTLVGGGRGVANPTPC